MADDQRPHELPPYPFPGPDPDMSRPDEGKVIKAEISLRLALHAGDMAETTSITEEEADLLLRQVVYAQRMALKDWLCNGSQEDFLKKYKKFSVCDSASCLSWTSGLELSGAPKDFSKQEACKVITPIDVRELLLHCCGHVFAVAVLPVRKPSGEVENESYLIDTTFRQFFDPDKESYAERYYNKDNLIESAEQLYPGHYLAQTLQGRHLADTLLRQGYVKLDRRVAKQYLDSLAYSNDAHKHAALPGVETQLVSGRYSSRAFYGSSKDTWMRRATRRNDKLGLTQDLLPSTPLTAIRRGRKVSEENKR